MKILSAVILILSVFLSPLKAESLNIVAIGYPPILTNTEQDFGIAGKALSEAMVNSKIDFHLDFLSSARAHQQIVNDNWCASFYPPAVPSPHYILVPLSHQFINLSLFRLTQNDPFVGDNIKAGLIAQLRLIQAQGEVKKFMDKGASLFPIETVLQGVKLLEKQRVDYLFTDDISFKFAIDSLSLNADNFQKSSRIYKRIPVGIWLNLNCPLAVETENYLQTQGYNRYNLQQKPLAI